MFPDPSTSRMLAAKWLEHTANVRRLVDGVWTDIATGISCSLVTQLSGPRATNETNVSTEQNEMWVFATDSDIPVERGDEVTVTMRDGRIVGPLGVAQPIITAPYVFQQARLTRAVISTPATTVTLSRWNQNDETYTDLGPYAVRIRWGESHAVTGTGGSAALQQGDAIFDDLDVDVAVGDEITSMVGGLVLRVSTNDIGQKTARIQRDAGYVNA